MNTYIVHTIESVFQHFSIQLINISGLSIISGNMFCCIVDSISAYKIYNIKSQLLDSSEEYFENVVVLLLDARN